MNKRVVIDYYTAKPHKIGSKFITTDKDVVNHLEEGYELYGYQYCHQLGDKGYSECQPMVLYKDAKEEKDKSVIESFNKLEENLKLELNNFKNKLDKFHVLYEYSVDEDGYPSLSTFKKPHSNGGLDVSLFKFNYFNPLHSSIKNPRIIDKPRLHIFCQGRGGFSNRHESEGHPLMAHVNFDNIDKNILSYDNIRFSILKSNQGKEDE